MKFITTALFAAILAASVPASAQFRKYSNEFLNIGAGARGLAMGSAQVASVKDGTAGYWNPAGLTGVQNYGNVNVMHAEYFAGIGKYDYASIALPVSDNKRTIGFTALRFAVDQIANTLFLIEPDGSINYNNITDFSAADYAFIVSMAQKVKETDNKKIQFGLNAKIIHHSVGKFAKSWGFGLDGGLQVETNRWKFGVMAKDVTTTFNAWSFSFTDREKERLYLTDNEIPVKSTELTAPMLVGGIARDFRLTKKASLLAEANLDFTFDGQRSTIISSKTLSIDPKIGIEANFNNVFFVRAGIKNFQRTLDDADTMNHRKTWIYQPSAGAGFRIQNVRIDYALSNLANQSNPLFTHVFSLQFDMVNDQKKKKK